MYDCVAIKGTLEWVLTGPDGEVLASGRSENLVTLVGQRMYLERGAGVTGALAAPTGMKLGTGSTSPAPSGTGAALTTYLTNSHQGFDSTYPQSAAQGSGRRVTYVVTYAAGKATSASPVTEAVLVNDTLADATSAESATVARVLLTGIPSKGSGETLTLTWNHDLTGA